MEFRIGPDMRIIDKHNVGRTLQAGRRIARVTKRPKFELYATTVNRSIKWAVK